MRGRTRPTRLGWRWRRNALRRRTDVVEALLVLVTTVLFCAVPLLGWWAGQSVNRTLQQVVRTQRHQRTLVTATLQPAKEAGKQATEAGKGAQASTASVRRGEDVLRWTAPDRSRTVTATVSSDLEVWHKDRIMLWTDRSGHLVPPPLDSATADTHAVLAGTAVASAAAGLLVISRQLLMWRLMARRMDSWEREWARVGQDWGRAGAGG
jgi:hypothetical protein